MSSKNLTLKIFLLISLCFASSFTIAQESGIIINEFSNGASGTKEYIEFLVVGCPGKRVDITDWKFDDNNGDFSGGPVANKGIAGGHSRFSSSTQWTSVPVGALILVYNSGDKNSSITLPDDPSDANNDSVYVLTHAYTALIQTCNNYPNTGTGNDSYTLCSTYGGGSWTTIGMRNAGDAAQIRKPDGTYFHGFGYGDNNGGPDNLYFPGDGTGKVYSYTSSDCNYRNITNFTAQSVAGHETPGQPNNASNLNYIRFLKERITPGVISANQTICPGQQPATLTESGTLVRCYINYQWQSSTTNTTASFQNISGAISATYTPPLLSTTTYFRRVVKNNCESDTSNIVTITVITAIARADKPTATETDLCVNAANSSVATNAVAGATGYTWELFPASAGAISGTTTTATIDWNNTYSGTAKVVVKAQGCGGNVASDTISFTISNAQPTAGSDQTSVCGTSATLAATGAGTGSWTIVSGTGGSFSNPTLRNAVFTGASGEAYQLQWNFAATSCTSADADNVQISFSVGSFSAGNDQTNICGNTTTLAATGTGSWTIVSGTGGSFSNSTLPNAVFTGTPGEAYQLQWNFAATSCVSAGADNVQISFSVGSFSAGNDQTNICGNTTTLAATGTGSWTIVSGTGGSFSNSTLGNAVFTGVSAQTYNLQWNYAATSCISAGADNVQISFSTIPNAPAAKDTSTCAAGSFNLVTSGGANGEYRWYDSNQNAIVNQFNNTYTTPYLTSSTTYYVALNNGDCESIKTPVKVTIKSGSAPAGIISGPAQSCGVFSEELSFNGVQGIIQWQDSTKGGIWTNIPAATSNTLVYHNPSAPVGIDYVRVSVTDLIINCAVAYSNVFVLLSDTCASKIPIRIPNAMTPNNDGSNDVFYIENISYYPDNHLIIFNRWGNKVYETDGYNNDWDGKDLPDATYYYLLELGKNSYGIMAQKNKYEGNVTILK